MMLPDEVPIEAGQGIVVRTTAKLAGAQPMYSFDVLLETAGSADSGKATLLGSMSYPE